MKITDTHAHLYMKEFSEDIDSVIQKAIHLGIHRFFIPSIDTSDIPNILKLEKKYPNICYPMIGLHPNKVFPNNLEKELNSIEKWLLKHSFISIGEIGMDLYLENKFVSEQEYAFQTQIKWAKKKKLPIVIHCRQAFDYIFHILSKEKSSSLRGVFHCFSGTLEEAKKIIDLGIKIGIGGMITFKNNHVSQFLHKISLDHIMLETDSPYLSPHPFRGKRNEPKNLRIILKKLSQIYSTSEEKIANIIHMNVENLFFS
ncbi:TatD-related desoxyribonuclease [Blattabacterium sp. (Blattella germanica) str. Bge]|uniref:TatD family hydrolase n=1 Tax=Blattabacterium sp. (Blattella germanica) TaxID=624186 RepID=UPI0001BB6251|nr:TatD family hydrolase [Blattabacterium sp. (Blattella germanica)]ACY40539.1 TatD-related desoxyribonuclease [Blattabacterium sp. (Blattella germanica) str. Bge]